MQMSVYILKCCINESANNHNNLNVIEARVIVILCRKCSFRNSIVPSFQGKLSFNHKNESVFIFTNEMHKNSKEIAS